MEKRFGQRENVLLGYSSPHRGGQSSSSEVDFNDVFGGPPRRASSSAAEVRNSSFGDSAASTSSVDRVSPRNPWSGLTEMPVFGEESSNRRRYPSDDFYDDIFRGDDSVNSPRRSEWESSGSRAVLSPGRRPLPVRADAYSTSLPAQLQLSLPAKSTKAENYPAFSPGNRSPRTPKDPSSSGISPPISSKSSLSRNLSASLQEEDELGNNIQPSYRPSPLSHKHSHESVEPACIDKSEESELPELKKDLNSTDALKDSYQFHFSIYRWASKGVPFSMPLRSSNSKGAVKIERCSTYHERVVSETMASGLQKAIWGDESDDLKLPNHSISSSKDAPDVKGRKLENDSFVKSISDLLKSGSSRDNALTSEKREETNTPTLSGKGLPKSSEKGVATNVQIMNRKNKEAKTVSVTEVHFPGSTKNGVDVPSQGAQEPELNPSGPGEQGGEKTSRNSEVKGQMAMNTAESHSNSDVKRSVNKPTEKRAASSKVEVNQMDKPLPQGSSKKPSDNRGRNRDKGKVKDFVKIFNQEAPSETKPEVGTQSQRSHLKGTSTSRGDKEEIGNTTQTNRQPHVDNLDEIKPASDTPIKVAKTLESENQRSHLKTSGNASGRKDAPESSSKPLPDGPTVIIENIDDILQDNFTIKDLSNDEEKQPQIEEGFEDIKALDAKIQKWSNGKKGNIRSLLSTLQQVLWPGSGWKPVPLVGIIEGGAVKRSYQRAMLCLHPDKLQQKGAAAHQKYIAEKVFDILQEAWDHFNSLGAM